MTRFIIAAATAVVFASPAFAQSACEQEAGAILSAVEASQLEDRDKTQVGAVLEQAQEHSRAGDEVTCQQAVEQVKVALGIQPQQPTQQ